MKMPIKRLFAGLASLAIACVMNAADATAVRYVVTLQVPQIEAAATAKDLAARYDGKVIPLTTQNFVGVAIETTPEAAARMAQDPRVSAVEAQFIGASPVNGPSRPVMLDTAGISTKGVAIPLPPALRDAPPAVAPRAVEAHVTAAPPVTVAHASTSQLHAVANGTGDWNSGTYSYDGAGNIYAIGSNYYVYDALGRLTEGTPAYESGVPSNTNRQTFAYDRYGNMSSKLTYANGAAAVSETVTAEAATNHLAAPVTYDASGNVTALGSNTYEWDAFNDLTSKTAVAKEQYLYDADDERIATIATNTTTFTLRGPDQKVLRELTRTTIGGQDIWSWKRDYVYRDDLLMAEVLPGTDGTAITRHFHLDHLGTPRVTTNELGARTSTTVFWPFGEEVASSVSPGTDPGDGRDPLRYTGHEYDPDPNGFDLNYMHARYELGRKGRFLSVDPTLDSADRGTPQSWNRYSYVLNNPVLHTDPDGRCSLAIVDCVIEGLVVAGSSGTLETFTVGLAMFTGAAYAASGGGSGGDSPALERHMKAVMNAYEKEAQAEQAKQAKQESADSAPKAKANSTLPEPPKGPGNTPPPDRDPKRVWTPKERAAKRAAQGGQCANGCGTKIDESNSRGHHIQRHADGGRTDDANHAEVCIDCHNVLHWGAPQ